VLIIWETGDIVASFSSINAADRQTATAEADVSAETIKCQWCGATSPARARHCVSCGSWIEEQPTFTEPAVAPPVVDVAEADASALVEWWRDDEDADGSEKTVPKRTLAEVEQRRLQSIGLMIGCVIACTFIGWIAGPLLAPFLEGLTGSPPDDSGALRSLGAFVGFLGGMFAGAVAGWITWSTD
jgi:ribosomal protein L40E